MFLQNDDRTGFCTPFDDTSITPADADMAPWSDNSLEIDGSGKLQIVNTGGSSAAEGGMGSGSESDKAKGDLENGGKSDLDNTSSNDPNKSWDPIKENIDEETNKRSDKQ